MEDKHNLYTFTDILNEDNEEINDSQPMSLISDMSEIETPVNVKICRPEKHTGQHGEFRSIEEIDLKYRKIFSYPFFNLIQSRVIEDALYSDKSIVVCAPTGSGKTVVFEMAIVKLLMDMEDRCYKGDFKIIYMAPVKALCTERLTEWYPKFTQLGCLCIEVTGDTDVDFAQLKPYKIIITTPEKWDMLTRRWTDHRGLVEVIKLFLIDEVHILNDEARGPALEAVVSRMKAIEASFQAAHRIESLQRRMRNDGPYEDDGGLPHIRFAAISATVSNPEDVAAWLGTRDKPAVYHKFGDECRPVKLNRIVEGYACPAGTSIFKFDIILNYKLWPIIQKYYNGKPTLIFCNTRKSVLMTAEILSRELTITFNAEQKAKLMTLASSIKTKKLQLLVQSGVGCHHAGLLYEERINIERAFRERDLPILITTTTLAMGVNLPAHLVIIKNTQQYVNGAYQEYSISTILQMVGRAGRPQFDVEATAVIMTRLQDKHRYQAMVGGSDPLQSYLHKRLAENLNSEAALHTISDVAQCVEWLRSTFLFVRAGRDPRRYLGLPSDAPPTIISKKIEELCVKAMNRLASSGLITMDEASCIETTEAGRLMSIYYLDIETMKNIMKINGTESLERVLWIVCESHELAEMHLRMDERRCLNTLNRNNASATIRFPMKGKITTKQMKVNCIIQAILGCLPINEPSLSQESMKIMRIADRICKCTVSYITRLGLISKQPNYYNGVLNVIVLAKCIAAQLWENSPYVSKQLRGIGATFSTLLATTGKNTFMLLEESHPRDLERIMNKGPPAGNIIRKQISLLPKYQLFLTPVDHNTVSVKLMLTNQAYLSENLDNLTAGINHKIYIIVGDLQNRLLHLNSFIDKDLIKVYDGSIVFFITRSDDYEQKITVHCISTTFVGIDVQADYVFEGIKRMNNNINVCKTEENCDDATSIKRSNTKKQMAITDVFKERKRKILSNNNIDSNEKRKKESPLIEKFKQLKEFFGNSSKELKSRLQKSTHSDNIIDDDIELENLMSNYEETTNQVKENSHDNSTPYDFSPITDEYSEFQELDKINNILNEIEKEQLINNHRQTNSNIRKTVEEKKNVNGNLSSRVPAIQKQEDKNRQQNNINLKHNVIITRNQIDNTIDNNKSRNINTYNFRDLLNRNVSFSDEDETDDIKNNGFTETIKNNLNNYLENTKLNCNKSISYDYGNLLKGTNSNKNLINARNKLQITDICKEDQESPLFKSLFNNKEAPSKETKDMYDYLTTEINTKLSHENEGLEIDTESECNIHNFDNRIGKILVKKNKPLKLIPNNLNHIELEQTIKYKLPLEGTPFVNTTNNIVTSGLNQNTTNVAIKNVDDEVLKNETEGNNNLVLVNKNDLQVIDNNIMINSNSNIKHDSSVISLGNDSTNKNKEISTSISENYNNIYEMNVIAKPIKNQPLHTIYLYNNINVSINKHNFATEKTTTYPDFNIKGDSFSNSLKTVKIINTQTSTMRESLTKIVNLSENIVKRTCKYEIVKKITLDVEMTEKVNEDKYNVNNLSYVVNKANNQKCMDVKSLKMVPNLQTEQKLDNKAPTKTSHYPFKNQFDIRNKTVEEIRKTCNKKINSYNSEEIMGHDKIKDCNMESDEVKNLLGDCAWKSKCLQPKTSIENILNKYNKVLRKNMVEDDNIKQHITPCKKNSQDNVKSKKPFNIQNINNMDVDLPEYLIEKTQSLDSNTQIERNENNTLNEEETQLITTEKIDLPDILCPHYSEVNDTIDQTMFNPKILLECFHNNSDNDEVIPPPEEYCDAIIDDECENSVNEHVLEDNFDDYCSDDETVNCNIYDYTKNIDEMNIFEDSMGPTIASVNVSTSQEIETWTLSPEESDYNNDYNNMGNPIKSFTVMRRIPMNKSCTNSQKLNSFKFVKKQKFRHKKY